MIIDRKETGYKEILVLEMIDRSLQFQCRLGTYARASGGHAYMDCGVHGNATGGNIGRGS